MANFADLNARKSKNLVIPDVWEESKSRILSLLDDINRDVLEYSGEIVENTDPTNHALKYLLTYKNFVLNTLFNGWLVGIGYDNATKTFNILAYAQGEFSEQGITLDNLAASLHRAVEFVITRRKIDLPDRQDTTRPITKAEARAELIKYYKSKFLEAGLEIEEGDTFELFNPKINLVMKDKKYVFPEDATAILFTLLGKNRPFVLRRIN